MIVVCCVRVYRLYTKTQDTLPGPLAASVATTADAVFCPSQFHVTLLRPEFARSLGRVVRQPIAGHAKKGL